MPGIVVDALPIIFDILFWSLVALIVIRLLGQFVYGVVCNANAKKYEDFKRLNEASLKRETTRNIINKVFYTTIIVLASALTITELLILIWGYIDEYHFLTLSGLLLVLILVLLINNGIKYIASYITNIAGNDADKYTPALNVLGEMLWANEIITNCIIIVGTAVGFLTLVYNLW